jgi:hypothetical protein
MHRRKTASLFDHLVGAGDEHRWNFNVERFGGLEIDMQLSRIGSYLGCVTAEFQMLESLYLALDHCDPRHGTPPYSVSLCPDLSRMRRLV